MKKDQTDRILLMISLGGFVLMSCSFILMPIANLKILPGLMFWAGLLAGGGLQMVLEARRRSFFKRYKVNRTKMQKPRNGLLSFGSNKEARIADFSMVIFCISTVLVLILTKGFGIICYVMITATVLTFCLHCIFNGRIYFHVNNQDKIRRLLERRKANSRNKGEGENETI